MTAARWREIAAKGGMVDLSRRSKWLLTGADRVRYLNGQVTQDVRRAGAAQAVYACVTDVKGRICGDVFIHVTEDGSGLLLDAEESIREELAARLERYLVADEVEIQDVSEDWEITHFFGAAAAGVEQGMSVERFGLPGREVWRPAGAEHAAAVPPELRLSAEEVEVLRVLNGVPKFPNELSGGVFPPEARLEARAMDFFKGCYIGQEVLSRIRTTRKMPRELVAWELAQETGGVAPDAPLTLPGAEAREVGRVTSVVTHPETGRAVGLGFVKLGSVPDDSQLLVGMELANIRRFVPVLSA